jgi:hypothetical protein
MTTALLALILQLLDYKCTGATTATVLLLLQAVIVPLLLLHVLLLICVYKYWCSVIVVQS